MRKLLIMLGSPASGKDYWIHKWKLNDLTISPDNIRQQTIAPKYVVNSNHKIWKQIDPSEDHQVWKQVYADIATRMKHGQFVVVNATNLFKSAFSRYNSLRIKYQYQVYIIDTMRQWMLDNQPDADYMIKQLVANDQKRQLKQVGKDVITDYVHRYLNRLDNNHQFQYPQEMHYIASDDDSAVENILAWQSTDMSKLKRIKVIGDVHGDYDALEKVFADHQRGDAYVFVGDYLDRGTKSPEVFRFITQTLGGDNLFFLKGNHENGWEQYDRGQKVTGQFAYDALPLLQQQYDEKDLKKHIHQFLKNIRNYLMFTIGKKTYFISHAGIEPFITKGNGETFPDSLFTMGIGPKDDPYSEDIDEIWNQHFPKRFYNIHGHRNNFDHYQVGTSYNLTKEGKFRWLVIEDNQITTHEIDRIDVPDFVDGLRTNPHIKQHRIEATGITANNFDETAFRKNIWDQQIIKARGLFTKDHKIVGRGFNKFFQIGQLPDATLDSLKFPVVVEKKWNGFLGITFWQNNQVQVYSKGGYEQYSELAREALKQTGWLDQLNEYFQVAANQQTTVLFEIIDPVNDPHIIKYDSVMTKPLAIIGNSEAGPVLNLQDSQGSNKPYQRLEKAIHEATYLGTANNLTELQKYLKRASESTEEGLVLYGQNKMLKYKTPFYLKAKELRSCLNRKTPKAKYYHGAEAWYKYCQAHNINRFTPNLALELYQLDLK